MTITLLIFRHSGMTQNPAFVIVEYLLSGTLSYAGVTNVNDNT